MAPLTFPVNPDVRPFTAVVAASNSSLEARQGADLVCGGTGTDDVAINALIAQIGAAGGGTIRFRLGTYLLSNTILIDYDYITLSGEGKCHWLSYSGAYPTHEAPGNPGGSLFYQQGAVNGITIGTTVANMNGDNRHKGIAIRDLYLYGAAYAVYSNGIYDNLHTDISEISTCIIHGFSAGINVAWDTGIINGNEIQDCAGNGIQIGNVYTVVSNNIVFDFNGIGIYSSAIGARIIGNIIGDVYSSGGGDGIQIKGGSQSVVCGNVINGVLAGNGIQLKNSASNCAINGNTISLTGVGTPMASNNTTLHGIAIGIDGTACSYNSINGNTIGNPATANSTGFAVNIGSAAAYNAVFGNTISGGKWNGGGSSTNVNNAGSNNSVTAANNPGQQ